MDARNNFAGGWDVPQPSNFLKAPPRTLLQDSDDDEDFSGPSPARRQKLENHYSSTKLSPNIEPYQRPNQARRTLLQTPPITAQPHLSDVVCEIFFLDNHDRLYAERVKKTLFDQNIVSEISLICPPSGGFIPAVEDAVRRSLMFACTITDQNNLHQSITVHILQGIHQVHRNMPLADAVDLIVENFVMLQANVVEKEHCHIDNVTPEVPFTPPDDNLKYLLNLAIDKRFLSVREMDEVIDYFEERRDELARAEGMKPRKVAKKRPLLPDPSTTAVATPEEEVSIETDMRSVIHNRLQDRIFQLLKRPEPAEDIIPHGTPLSSSAGSSVGVVADDVSTMAQALEILTSNPILKQLIGIPSPNVDPLPTPGPAVVHAPVVKPALLAKYNAVAAVSSSSSVYFNRGPLLSDPHSPLLSDPHSSLPPYH